MNNELKKSLTALIFNNLRILNGVTPRDTYIQNYRWHYNKWGDSFFDLYHLAAYWGYTHSPKRIMEIGSRTGLSLAQLLSTYKEYPTDLKIVLFDRWDDGLSNPLLIKTHLTHLNIPVDNIEFYQGDSMETVPGYIQNNLEQKFDWILVDGAHVDETASIDLENAYKLISQNGIIVFDDIGAIEELDNINLRPTWERFKNNHFEEFIWNEDLNGKGVAWAIKI